VNDSVHILLIEDNIAEARFLQEVLKGAVRFKLAHAKRMSEAIAQIEAVQSLTPFHISLLDLTLPDSTGLDSLDLLVQSAPSLPIVVLTNTNDEELAVEAVRRGAQDYLIKRQVNLDILVRSLRYAIERKQAAVALQEANELLERRVQERTNELAEANVLLRREIAAKKQLEAQFLQAQRLESLGTLASGIAHDLNNILTPILAVAQLLPLKLPHIDPQSREMLRVLEASARRGGDLIKQILSFGRGMEGQRVPLQVNHLLLEIHKIMQQTLPKSIRIQLDLDSDLEAVWGDATQIHQVLMNLCVNARDAMPEGGQLTLMTRTVVLDESALHIHVDAQAGNYAVVSIADTGSGIPPEIIYRIFDPFFTTKDIGKGTGLGLSAVLGIIKSHGGFVTVKSQLNQGSEFKVYLPVQSKAIATENDKNEIPQGNQELVLVIDDEVSICEMVRVTLETYHYRVVTLSNSMEAIALYTQQQADVKHVLIDLMMPGMDGLTTIALLQQINPALHIVAMSGLSVPSDSAAESSGYHQFLAKPFTTNALLQALQQ
jgi:two-component system, cell cycle sensor histidine kinase and response regulator CckA